MWTILKVFGPPFNVCYMPDLYLHFIAQRIEKRDHPPRKKKKRKKKASGNEGNVYEDMQQRSYINVIGHTLPCNITAFINQ